MQCAVLKFKIPSPGVNSIRIPKGAVVRHVGWQKNDLYMWCEVQLSESVPEVERLIYVRPTGSSFFSDKSSVFVGTAVNDDIGIVAHVYDGGEIS